MSEVRNTLNERGTRYGRFDHHADLAERLIRVAQFQMSAIADLGKERPGWLRLAPDQRHSIRYILDKIARILEGDPDYTDNWHDIAGYATLIEDRLNGTGLYATYAVKQVVKGEYTMLRGTDGYVCKACFAKVGDAHAPDCIHAEATRLTR